MNKPFTPGFRFKEGKLYIFKEEQAFVLSTWPELTAVAKRGSSRWSAFWPYFRVIFPYRPKTATKGKAGDARQLNLELQITSVADRADERKHAFDAYRFSFPKDIASAVEKFLHGQWSVLHLLKADAGAIDLVRSNSMGTWLG